MNPCAVDALFPRFPPLVALDGDIEANPEDYVDGALKPVETLRGWQVAIYKGMLMYLMRNAKVGCGLHQRQPGHSHWFLSTQRRVAKEYGDWSNQ